MAESHHHPSPVTHSWLFWVFVCFALVGLAFLMTFHAEHSWQYLPFVLLLACPFLHFFGHKGHKH